MLSGVTPVARDRRDEVEAPLFHSMLQKVENSSQPWSSGCSVGVLRLRKSPHAGSCFAQDDKVSGQRLPGRRSSNRLSHETIESVIQLSSAGKRFGHKLLFEGADWMITPRDRIGLVGANGTGKSTLLKILAGSESLDYGSVNRAKGISAGYLPQDGLALSGRTVFAECMSVFSKLRAMEKEMEELTGRMSELDHSSPEYTQVAERYQRLEHEFTSRDGYAIEAQVGAVLGGLGFRKEDWTRQTEEFSGGWQMRIALAKLLLQKPNLLLLDEPTNHLDLEARNWLEEYLSNYPYAFVLISHDRYFLDVTVNKIAEIWNKRVHLYTGNYEKYLNAKDAAPGTARSRLSQSARAHRATRSLHQPLPLSGDESQAGAEPHQGTGKDRAHRASRRRKDHPLLISRSPSPAAGSSPSSTGSRRATARKKYFAASIS